MKNVTIYHNPRCTKSRQTLKLLQDNNITPVIIEYLKTPPDTKMLDTILKKLNIQPADVVRKKEDTYKSLGLKNKSLNRDSWLKVLVSNPVLLERPIVVSGTKAVIGRPPENVLDIL